MGHATNGAGVPALPQPDAPARSLCVLVVDDDPRIVAASTALLEALGHRAIGVRSTRDALAVVDPIDAALVDYQLGAEVTGLGLIAQLRTRRAGLAALLLTAETAPEVRAEAAALGVAVLPKPANPAAIEAFLRQVSTAQVNPE